MLKESISNIEIFLNTERTPLGTSVLGFDLQLHFLRDFIKQGLSAITQHLDPAVMIPG
jgi:hypothetical protein